MFKFSLLASAGMAVSLTAFAQDEDPNRRLNTIKVEGTKMEQSLFDVPDSVAVVTAEEISRAPVSDLYDIIGRIPNVTPAFGEQGFAIRGIDQRGVGGGGNGNTLTVYVDDAPLGNQTTFFGPTGSWDVGQVEVFRGPQSTNFGRNALAGAIYIKTQEPTYEPELKVRAEVADYDTYQISAAGGMALIEDKLAFRLSGDYRESQGFIENVFLDQPADETELSNLRAKLLFEPTENLRIVTTTTYAENFGGEDTIDPASGFRPEANYDVDGREGTETFLQSVNAEWDFAPGWSLQSITSFQTTDYVRIEDYDVTPLPVAVLDRTGEDEALSQEVRLKYQGEKLSGVLGLYYVDAERGFDDSLVLPASILSPAIPSSILISRTSFFGSEEQNFAVFADGEYALTDGIDLLFGLRYDHEDGTITSNTDTKIITDIPPGFEFLRAYEGIANENTSADFSTFLPKVGLQWAAGATTNVAFVIQQGYRAGGSEIDVVTSQVNDFDPEYLLNYELSTRSVFMAGRLQWNNNIFYGDWTDQQVPVPIDPTIPNFTLTVNAGESSLYGFETDLSWDAGNDLLMYGSLGYVKTEFEDFPVTTPVPGNLSGNEFPFAPNWSANFGFDKRHANGVFYGTDVNYLDSMFSDNENLPQNELDPVVLVNARLGYEFNETYRVTLYARNLFDEEYYSFINRDATTGAGTARLGDPQVIGLRFDATL